MGVIIFMTLIGSRAVRWRDDSPQNRKHKPSLCIIINFIPARYIVMIMIGEGVDGLFGVRSRA